MTTGEIVALLALFSCVPFWLLTIGSLVSRKVSEFMGIDEWSDFWAAVLFGSLPFFNVAFMLMVVISEIQFTPRAWRRD